MKTLFERVQQLRREDGAAGYIFLWLLGVPLSVIILLYLIF